MRDRFKILLRLTHYSFDEMYKLLEQRAKRLGWLIEEECLKELASRARGVPRLGVRFLDAAKRASSAKGSDEILKEHVASMLTMEGFDELGFDSVEQSYLRLLKEHGLPVRLNVLSTALGLPKQTIEMIERDFIRLDLIIKSEKGRSLTPKGIKHVSNA
jgi:Holliday junction DNA helicase RuvB